MAFLRNLFRRKKERLWKPKDKTAIGARQQEMGVPVDGVTEGVKAAKLGVTDRSFLTGVLLHPHVTEKATNLGAENKYVFVVKDASNKNEIKRTVEGRYAVRVQEVNLIRLPAKFRRRGRQTGWKPGLKKAVITLKEGQSIEIL